MRRALPLFMHPSAFSFNPCLLQESRREVENISMLLLTASSTALPRLGALPTDYHKSPAAAAKGSLVAAADRAQPKASPCCRSLLVAGPPLLLPSRSVAALRYCKGAPDPISLLLELRGGSRHNQKLLLTSRSRTTIFAAQPESCYQSLRRKSLPLCLLLDQ